jgi:hypothetical protein
MRFGKKIYEELDKPEKEEKLYEYSPNGKTLYDKDDRARMKAMLGRSF